MAESVLLADVGNSRVKLSQLGQAQVVAFDWQCKDGRKQLRNWVEENLPARIVVASTSPRADEILHATVWQGLPLQQLYTADVPLEILTEGTGMDRLLSAWVIWQQGQCAALIADCGTAFTVDFVDANGRFHGGAIGAGLSVQERALAKSCPHLDLPVAADTAIPNNTAGAVYAGTTIAMALAIEGLAQRFEQEQVCEATRFLSGGDSPRLQEFLAAWQRRDNLVLEALALYVQSGR